MTRHTPPTHHASGVSHAAEAEHASEAASAAAGLPPPMCSPWADGHWAGLQQGRLMVQRCVGCGLLRHYPRPMCPSCRSLDSAWQALAGAGTLHSWTVLHRSGLAGLLVPLPLTLLTVDMAEGVRLLGQLIGPGAALRPGLALQASVAPGATGVLQPVFRLA